MELAISNCSNNNQLRANDDLSEPGVSTQTQQGSGHWQPVPATGSPTQRRSLSRSLTVTESRSEAAGGTGGNAGRQVSRRVKLLFKNRPFPGWSLRTGPPGRRTDFKFKFSIVGQVPAPGRPYRDGPAGPSACSSPKLPVPSNSEPSRRRKPGPGSCHAGPSPAARLQGGLALARAL